MAEKWKIQLGRLFGLCRIVEFSTLKRLSILDFSDFTADFPGPWRFLQVTSEAFKAGVGG